MFAFVFIAFLILVFLVLFGQSILEKLGIFMSKKLNEDEEKGENKDESDKK